MPRKRDVALWKMKEKLKEYGEIYYIVNNITQKGYVGQTLLITGKDLRNHGSEIRLTEHFQDAVYRDHCRCLNASIRKYGKDAFTVIPLLCCKIEHLSIWEDYFMKEYNTLVPNGYNLREAGRCGRASVETREKMSIAHSGEKHHQWGKALTAEHREKIRQTNINNAAEIRRDKDKVTTLPKYLKYVCWKSEKAFEEGYHIIAHPLCKQKKFSSTKEPVDLAYHKDRALSYLEGLNAQLEWDNENPV